METTEIVCITAVSLIVLSVIGYFIWIRHKQGDKFNLSTDPLPALPYSKETKNCGVPEFSHGIGGQYGLNPEYNNNITVCDFVKDFEKDTVFTQYKQNLVPSLLHNQTAYDIPAAQICEVLYDNHQQFFENRWSGLGECEMYYSDKAKNCKDIHVKTV